MRFLSASLLITLLLFSYSADAFAAGQAVKPASSDKLNRQIDTWLKGLGAEPGFKKLLTAKREIMPIGPGTHGWVVHFLNGNKTTGYMIVHALPNDRGYHLTEYGLGEHPLFAMSTLHDGLARLGLTAADNGNKPLLKERLYINPLLAVWHIHTTEGTSLYLDAYTAEELPIGAEQWASTAEAGESSYLLTGVTSLASSPKLERAVRGQSFDLYARLPWLTGQPLRIKDSKMLAGKLSGKAELRLTSEWFDGSWLAVAPLNGIHVWTGGIAYIQIEQEEGTRYFLYDEVKRHASVYE
ncbi:hypothetical protein DNH61_11230 [Paenibacillus sambharensis]|uniref:Uncharacterized protein n=1 Tax=Paenibacillus sambharensis TaxID=1803190 RepID=A0A2W1LAR8_9BACL|nr:hypothetical protein [Paenibacillus sambharensis]PZD95993.1 hypothetical protein DNH61_11230 [Paenibacillus sambharensis]